MLRCIDETQSLYSCLHDTKERLGIWVERAAAQRSGVHDGNRRLRNGVNDDPVAAQAIHQTSLRSNDHINWPLRLSFLSCLVFQLSDLGRSITSTHGWAAISCLLLCRGIGARYQRLCKGYVFSCDVWQFLTTLLPVRCQFKFYCRIRYMAFRRSLPSNFCLHYTTQACTCVCVLEQAPLVFDVVTFVM